MNLEQCQTRNCCQCPPIDITEDTISKGDYLLNGDYVRQRRKELLKNTRHADCAKCWVSEDRGGASMRSTSLPKNDFLAKNNGPDFNKSPRFKQWEPLVRANALRTLEISLGSLCNLKCQYCTPVFSSAWEREIKQHGHYPMERIHRSSEEVQAQVETDVLATLSEHFSTIEKIIFIGGEPLLNKKIYPMLERVAQVAKERSGSSRAIRPELQIVTNLSIPEKSLDQFLDIAKDLIKYFKINISASIDNTGTRAEYIRYGLDWDVFERNVHKVLGSPQISWLSFHTTVSILNITSMMDILRLSKQLFDLYKKPVPLMDNMVTIPAHLSPLILTSDFASHMHECSDYVRKEIHSREPSFQAFINFTKKIGEAISATRDNASTRARRRQFHEWISYHDKIRTTAFLETFPDYEVFFNLCARS